MSVTPNQIFDLVKLYERTFGNKPYHVPAEERTSEQIGELFNIPSSTKGGQYTPKGSLLKETVNGVEIWLPVRFYDGPALLMHLPYSVVKISTKKTIIETPLAERKGTVKEQFSFEDYSISIKGFLIDENREFPESQLEQLKQLYNKSQAVTLDNALTNIFLTDPDLRQDEQRRVVIYDLDIAEVTGGRLHVRPFSMNLKSDSVFTLELED